MGGVAVVTVVAVLLVKFYWRPNVPRRAFKHRVIVLSPPAKDAAVHVVTDGATQEDNARLFYRWADPGSAGRPFDHNRHQQNRK